MMKITNNYSAVIVLPPNEPVLKGQSINYPNWDTIKDMANIAWYVEKGFLMVEDSGDDDESEEESDDSEVEEEESEEEQEEESAADEKTQLIADLAELGVEVDGRTGVKKLRAMLEEKLAEAE